MVTTIEEIEGHSFTDIRIEDDEVRWYRSDGKVVIMYHQQDCCENVTVDEWDGNIEDMINIPIHSAVEVTSSEDLEGGDSCTWTFYKFYSEKGYLHITWKGVSNGYYSERVSIRIEDGKRL